MSFTDQSSKEEPKRDSTSRTVSHSFSVGGPMNRTESSSHNFSTESSTGGNTWTSSVGGGSSGGNADVRASFGNFGDFGKFEGGTAGGFLQVNDSSQDETQENTSSTSNAAHSFHRSTSQLSGTKQPESHDEHTSSTINIGGGLGRHLSHTNSSSGPEVQRQNSSSSHTFGGKIEGGIGGIGGGFSSNLSLRDGPGRTESHHESSSSTTNIGQDLGRHLSHTKSFSGQQARGDISLPEHNFGGKVEGGFGGGGLSGNLSLRDGSGRTESHHESSSSTTNLGQDLGRHLSHTHSFNGQQGPGAILSSEHNSGGKVEGGFGGGGSLGGGLGGNLSLPDGSGRTESHHESSSSTTNIGGGLGRHLSHTNSSSGPEIRGENSSSIHTSGGKIEGGFGGGLGGGLNGGLSLQGGSGRTESHREASSSSFDLGGASSGGFLKLSDPVHHGSSSNDQSESQQISQTSTARGHKDAKKSEKPSAAQVEIQKGQEDVGGHKQENKTTEKSDDISTTQVGSQMSQVEVGSQNQEDKSTRKSDETPTVQSESQKPHEEVSPQKQEPKSTEKSDASSTVESGPPTGSVEASSQKQGNSIIERSGGASTVQSESQKPHEEVSSQKQELKGTEKSDATSAVPNGSQIGSVGVGSQKEKDKSAENSDKTSTAQSRPQNGQVEVGSAKQENKSIEESNDIAVHSESQLGQLELGSQKQEDKSTKKGDETSTADSRSSKGQAEVGSQKQEQTTTTQSESQLGQVEAGSQTQKEASTEQSQSNEVPEENTLQQQDQIVAEQSKQSDSQEKKPQLDQSDAQAGGEEPSSQDNAQIETSTTQHSTEMLPQQESQTHSSEGETMTSESKAPEHVERTISSQDISSTQTGRVAAPQLKSIDSDEWVIEPSYFPSSSGFAAQQTEETIEEESRPKSIKSIRSTTKSVEEQSRPKSAGSMTQRAVERESMDEATERTPLIARDEEANVDETDASAAPRKKRRWPSIIALAILCIAVILAIVFGFAAPAAVEEYAKEAITFETSNITIETFTNTGMQVRAQGVFYLDGSKVKKQTVRNLGRAATYIAYEIESKEAELDIYLPEYNHTLLGLVKVPSIILNIRNGHRNYINIVSTVEAGNGTGVADFAQDMINGKKTIDIKASGWADVKSGIFSFGNKTFTTEMTVERSGNMSMPAFNITSLSVSEFNTSGFGILGFGSSGYSQGIVAKANVSAFNPYPVTVNVPAIAFDIMLKNCSGQPTTLGNLDLDPIHIVPNDTAIALVAGIMHEMPSSLTNVCPNSDRSPLDKFISSYMSGNTSHLYVKGGTQDPNETPFWIGKILERIVVPVPVPSHPLKHSIKSVSTSNVHFKLPGLWGDPYPRISADVNIVAGLPENVDINVFIHGIKAESTVYYKGKELGEMNLKQWQAANSSKVGDDLHIQMRFRDAPIKITSQSVFTDVVHAMIFGKTEIIMEAQASVDVNLTTALGTFIIRKIPGHGKIPINHLNMTGAGQLKQTLKNITVADTSEKQLVVQAVVEAENPSPFFATIPYVNISVWCNSTQVGYLWGSFDIHPGNNTITADSAFFAGPVGAEMLSQYISGWNTTITLKTHNGSIPGFPDPELSIDLPMPHMPGSFFKETTMHIFSSTATFVLYSPLPMWITSIDSNAYYKGKSIGAIKYDEEFEIVVGDNLTPRLPVSWNFSGGWDMIKAALGGNLKLDAHANVSIRIGKWKEKIWYDGHGLGAKITL